MILPGIALPGKNHSGRAFIFSAQQKFVQRFHDHRNTFAETHIDGGFQLRKYFQKKLSSFAFSGGETLKNRHFSAGDGKRVSLCS